MSIHKVLVVDDSKTEQLYISEILTKNGFAVRTASSEQVRQPIFRDGTEAWKPFAPHLGPLEDALGPVLAAYPGVPDAW